MSFKKSLLFVALFTLGTTMVCHGQAWIPPKDMGAISFNYQTEKVEDHYNGLGVREDVGHIMANNVVADFSYSLTNNLAFSVNLPFISAKYNGQRPHQVLNASGGFTIPIDDGTYHSTFQDFSFQVRYNLAKNPLQLTPYIRAIIPSHDYEFFGHAAAGIDTKRIQFGTYLGRTLDPIFPNTYIEGRFGYTFKEKTLDISTNYSSADLTLGYFVTPSFRVFAFGTGQYTHGGIDNQTISPRISTNPYFYHHDQIGRSNYLNLGGGASYSINNSIDVYGGILNTVSGRNYHAIKYAVTFGISYGFQGFRPPDNQMNASNKRDGKAVCICATKEAGGK